MTKGLKIAQPPKRPVQNVSPHRKKTSAVAGEKFIQSSQIEMTQFNKRIKKGVADGYAMLAIKTNKKVPNLLEEALEMLQNKYGKI